MFPQNTVACIQHLYPESKNGKDWGVDSVNSVISIHHWNTDIGTEPTEDEINAVSKTVEAEYDAHEYARNRAAEYPSIAELTVALYDTDDKAAIETKRAAVKAKYPKPS